MAPEQDSSALARRLGRNIVEARKLARLTQGQLADLVSVEPETISRVERGVAPPSLKLLSRIGEALGVATGGLMDGHAAQGDTTGLVRRIAMLPQTEQRIVVEMASSLCALLQRNHETIRPSPPTPEGPDQDRPGIS